MHEIVTDLGYFVVTAEGLRLTEIAEGVTVDEIRAKTGCPFTVTDPLPTLAI